MSEKSFSRIVQNVVGGLHTLDVSAKDDSNPVNEQDHVVRVALGADHGGFEAKEVLKAYLTKLGYRVYDVGTFSKESVDYPDFALKVAQKVASGECERGIMIDGAGIGSCMVCNKVRGIRAALCYDRRTIINSREHNNANVLTLGGPLHPPEELCELVKLWLETRFAGGRHWSRINKMMAIERGR
ncbi:MAG: ribose 5-phosphate isomerase B [Candidatus Atribacteria bacterium]|nr:ribose 5-phosphate isomerase B [Candidatus Atribacteria bacterium]